MVCVFTFLITSGEDCSIHISAWDLRISHGVARFTIPFFYFCRFTYLCPEHVFSGTTSMNSNDLCCCELWVWYIHDTDKRYAVPHAASSKPMHWQTPEEGWPSSKQAQTIYMMQKDIHRTQCPKLQQDVLRYVGITVHDKSHQRLLQWKLDHSSRPNM